METSRTVLEILQGAINPLRCWGTSHPSVIILQRDWGERHGESGGGQNRASDWDRLKVGADEIEVVLGKSESGPCSEIGGVQNHKRAAARHIGICTAVENVFIVIFLRQIASTIQDLVKPVPRSGNSEQ